jgi:hypothetical protein
MAERERQIRATVPELTTAEATVVREEIYGDQLDHGRSPMIDPKRQAYLTTTARPPAIEACRNDGVISVGRCVRAALTQMAEARATGC